MWLISKPNSRAIPYNAVYGDLEKWCPNIEVLSALLAISDREAPAIPREGPVKQSLRYIVDEQVVELLLVILLVILQR